MAIWTKYSGTMDTSNKYLKYRIGLTLNSQNIASNTSNVTVFIQAWRTNTGYTTYGTGTAYCTINGTAYSQGITSSQKITYNSYTQLFSQTLNIAHGTNGAKTLAMAASIAIPNISLSSSSQSYSQALNTIPRYTSITGFSATVIERNRIDISWSAANTCNYWWYSLNGGSTWVAVGAISASSGSRAITGLAAGTAYSLRVRVRRSDSNLTTDSGTSTRTTLGIAYPIRLSLDDRTCTGIDVGWSASNTVINVQYSLNGSSWQNGYGSSFGATQSGHFWIGGLAANTTYKVQIRTLDAVHTGTWSGGSGITNMTTLYLTTSSPPVFKTGDSFTVPLSRSSTSIYNDVTLQIWASSQQVVDIASRYNQGANVTFLLNSSELDAFYKNRTSSYQVETRFKIVSRWGSSGSIQGTTYTNWGISTIVDASPTLSGVTYKDINSTIQAILGNNQKILRNLSDLQVITGTATSQKYATLKSYKVSIGGGEYTTNTSGTSETGKAINVGKVNQSANQTAVLTVTDSRGYTASKSFTVQMLDYLPPQFIQASADRLNSYEETTTMNIEARRSIVSPSTTDLNVIDIRYRLKENPSGEYGNYINVNLNESSVLGLWKSFTASQYMADYPNNKSYTVELGIKDKFTDWNTILITLTEGIALLRFLQDKIIGSVPLELINHGADSSILIDPAGRLIIDSEETNNISFPKGRKIGAAITGNANNIVEEWVLITGENLPANHLYWYLQTILYSDDRQIKQIAYGYMTDEIYTRYKYYGVWSNWSLSGGPIRIDTLPSPMKITSTSYLAPDTPNLNRRFSDNTIYLAIFYIHDARNSQGVIFKGHTGGSYGTLDVGTYDTVTYKVNRIRSGQGVGFYGVSSTNYPLYLDSLYMLK